MWPVFTTQLNGNISVALPLVKHMNNQPQPNYDLSITNNVPGESYSDSELMDIYEGLTPNQIKKFSPLMRELAANIITSAVAATGSDYQAPPGYDYDSTSLKETKKMANELQFIYQDNLRRIISSNLVLSREVYRSGNIPPIAPDYMRSILRTLLDREEGVYFSTYQDKTIWQHLLAANGATIKVVQMALDSMLKGHWDSSVSFVDKNNP